MKVATALKVLSLIFTLLLIIVVAPIGFILLTDANDFKPELEQLALEQGVELNISGDLKWRVYPDIELEVNDVAVKAEEGILGLDAVLGVAMLQVELRPLFSGELKIRGVEVLDTEVKLTELAETAPRENESPDSNNETSVDVQLVSVQALKLEYRSIAGEHTELEIKQLHFERFNLAGNPFSADFTVIYGSGQSDSQTKVSAETLLSIDLKEQKYGLETEQLMVEISSEVPAEIRAELSVMANLSANQWNLSLTRASLSDLELQANASGKVEPLSALGQLEITGGDQFINSLMGHDLLDGIHLETSFDYSPDRLFSDVAAVFNQTNLSASLQYYLSENQIKQNELTVNLDKINLDDLLPAEGSIASGAEGPKSVQESEVKENPLLFLDTLPATHIVMTVGELSANDQNLTDIEVDTVIENSEARIRLINANLAEGTIKGIVDARSQKIPQLLIPEFSVNQINLAPLTLDESGNPLLQGMTDASFSGQLESLSDPSSAEGSILKGLNGSGQLDIANLVLADANIEQSICASAQQLGATAALTNQWAPGTEFDQMKSPYQVNKGVLSLESIGTGFGNIKLGGNGQLDLDTMDFGAKLSLRINGERTSEQGCSINKYLRNTSLPLSCEGNLAEDGDTSCGLDGSVVAELLKGQIKNQIGRQLNRLLGIEEKAIDVDGREGASEENANNSEEQSQGRDSGDDVKDAVKGLLEGLFK